MAKDKVKIYAGRGGDGSILMEMSSSKAKALVEFGVLIEYQPDYYAYEYAYWRREEVPDAIVQEIDTLYRMITPIIESFTSRKRR